MAQGIFKIKHVKDFILKSNLYHLHQKEEKCITKNYIEEIPKRPEMAIAIQT